MYKLGETLTHRITGQTGTVEMIGTIHPGHRPETVLVIMTGTGRARITGTDLNVWA